ncbi:HTH-type transcriptional activator IlvY [Geomonas sp. Red32]|uniref:HTH-type transcriptional activator IlvY n=1 Tax=Geomonas sp. Red32 TaxID=2912856 RepID=UPI00202D067A|nr:HTH-type transcriptional activator IlvY [Geomonas sp. Red32]
MDMRELEVFLTLAELLHFGRASQACNLSPSALSRTIQRMEEQLEQPLFIRDNRKVLLTPAGERLKRYARLSLDEWRNFRLAIKNEQAVAGTLSIYASITAVYSLLPQLLENFRWRYPEVQLELRTGAAEQAIPQIQRGEIDLAVAPLPDGSKSGLAFLPMVTIPLIFIAPRTEGFALAIKDESIDLARTPLVLPQTGLSRRRLDQWLKEHRIAPSITSEVSGNEAIIAMVRLGCGVGVVPRLVLERSPFRDEVTVLENAPRLDPYEVGLATSGKNLQRPSVRAFWELAERGLSRLPATE